VDNSKSLLSDLILAGAQLRPQASGDYFRINGDDIVCSCALGAAKEALGFDPSCSDLNEKNNDRVNKIFADKVNIDPPIGLAQYTLSSDWTLCETIIHMNDKLKMTREEIAAILKEHGL